LNFGSKNSYFMQIPALPAKAILQVKPGAHPLLVMGLQVAVAAYADETPATNARAMTALIIFFIVLLFCCFVVSPHSKTTPFSYPFHLPNQPKSCLFVWKCRFERAMDEVLPPPVADPVPEPSTYALFGLGVFGMLMVMRRKRAA